MADKAKKPAPKFGPHLREMPPNDGGRSRELALIREPLTPGRVIRVLVEEIATQLSPPPPAALKGQTGIVQWIDPKAEMFQVYFGLTDQRAVFDFDAYAGPMPEPDERPQGGSEPLSEAWQRANNQQAAWEKELDRVNGVSK